MFIHIPDFDILEAEGDLFVLRAHLTFVEEQFDVQAKKAATKRDERLAKLEAGPRPRDREEWEEEQAERRDIDEGHDHWVADVLPRLLVNPFVVAVWSVIEAVTMDLAELLHTRMKAGLTIHNIKGRHFPDQAEKYFEHILRLPLNHPDTLREELGTLIAFRNCIAHSNGRAGGVSKQLRNRLEAGEVAGARLSADGDYIALEVGYARTAFDLAQVHLERVFALCRATR